MKAERGVKASVLTVGGDQQSQRIQDPADPFRSAMLAIAEVRAETPILRNWAAAVPGPAIRRGASAAQQAPASSSERHKR